MNKFSSSMCLMGAFIGTFSCMNTSHANEIVVDLNNHTLTYTDKILDVRLEYPIVAPRKDVRYIYGQERHFSVKRINIWPNWQRDDGKRYPGGHPSNPLGYGRITFLNQRGGLRPCAIHGKGRIADMGKNLSGCCVRITDKNIRELMMYTTNDTSIELIY